MKNSVYILLALLVFITPVPAQTQPAPETEEKPVTDDEFRLPVDQRTGAEIDRLILLLDSPDYKEREEATETLLTIGATSFRKLRSTYLESDELEVQLRIEKIVHQSYRVHHVLSKTGFLGISTNRRYPGHDVDPRIPAGRYGVELHTVQPNTGAERAGLKPKDIIIEMNGEVLAGERSQVFINFSSQIRKLGPGQQIQITILRGDETLEITATLGPVPNDRFLSVNGVRAMVQKVDRRFTVWWSRYFLKD